jgi:RNA-directed DNA polymerase
VNDSDDLAAVLLLGPWSRVPVALRLAHRLGYLSPHDGIDTLAVALLARWPVRPDRVQLAAYLAQLPELSYDPQPPQWASPNLDSTARPRLHRPMVRTSSRQDLRTLLWLTDDELDWFADRQARNARLGAGPLQHYRYRLLTESTKLRLLEIPKPRLKEIQRRLLEQIVRSLPLHPAAHGSVPGRSVATCIAPHVHQAIVVRCDLESFFAAVTQPRVTGLMRRIGLDDEAARLVGGLTTAVVPYRVRQQLIPAVGDLAAHRRALARLAVGHLPQGSPTSPGLANAVTFSLDHRLARLAESLGAAYTRYVDDLVFSGPGTLPVSALLGGTRQIVRDEGFRLTERKTAVLRNSRRQSVLGTVVNEVASVDRRELDRLRAVLHNCATSGVSAQCRDRSVASFRLQLQGQIAWVSSINPTKGLRLQQRFDALSWPSPADRLL